MKFIFAFMMVFLLASCADDTDFAFGGDNCGEVEILSPGGASILMRRDGDVWNVMAANGGVLCNADAHKVAAFFNVLRDIQVMGLSERSVSGKFDSEIRLRTASGRDIKSLRFVAVPGSPNMIGSVDGGKCYVVGVPGLKQSPIVDFSPQVDYWKDRMLLFISSGNVSMVSVENLVEPGQSFKVTVDGNALAVSDIDGNRVDAADEAVRLWLGSIAGSYRANGYEQAVDLPDADIIYRLRVGSLMGMEDSIVFYKKRLADGQPDFNLMYFRKGDDFGTAKYFDFDKLLVDLERLR